MGADDLQAGGLADDGGCRPGGVGQRVDQHRGAVEAVLLVVGEGEVYRSGHVEGRPPGGECQHAGHEPLHVGGTPPVDAVVDAGGGERRRRPVVGVDGHDVAVAGQHDPTVDHRADRGEQVGLGAGGVVAESDVGGHAVEAVDHPGDEVDVGRERHRREGDQVVEDREGVVQ